MSCILCFTITTLTTNKYKYSYIMLIMNKPSADLLPGIAQNEISYVYSYIYILALANLFLQISFLGHVYKDILHIIYLDVVLKL